MNTHRLFCLCASIIVLTAYKVGQFLTYAESVAKCFSYVNETQNSYVSLVPRRLGDAAWTNVSKALACARQSRSVYPKSKGFLYNQDSGLCRALLWLQGQNAKGAQPLQPEEGDLFLLSGLCGGQFTIMEFGNSGDLACLKYVRGSPVTMVQATAHCQSLGSHLVHVRTLPKLELIQSFATENVWVGFKYLRSEGIHVWTGDGKKLTRQVIEDTFHPGEPNDSGGEDCGEFNHGVKRLNDVSCDRKRTYICELDLPDYTD